MDKDELIKKVDLQKKYTNKLTRSVVPLLLGFAGLGIFAIVKEITLIIEHRVLFSLCFLFVILSVSGMMIWLMFRNMKKIGLVCSTCQKIIYKDFQLEALTTLKCVKCGNVIITNNRMLH